MRLAGWVLIVICSFGMSASAQEFPIKLGKQVNGFHIPQRYLGRTIILRWPRNEHTIHAVEDLIAVIGARNDILVWETNDIQNAYAVIDGRGNDARRMIVFDDMWMTSVPRGQYRVILAHEVGHHVCRHTLDRYAATPWDIELEADRTAGALLRRAHDQNFGVGGAMLTFDDMITSARAYLAGSGSESHPPGEMRVNAYIDGWNNGSPCLNTAYVPVNPIPEATVIESIAYHYGNKMRWWFRYSYVETKIEGNHMRIVFESPSPDQWQAGARRGSLLFEGTSDTKTIKGTFRHYASGCEPTVYAGEGNFVPNNFIAIVGKPPKLTRCRIVGEFAGTLHLFKNTGDWGFVPPK